MYTYSNTYLNRLKEQVVRDFGVTEIHSSDCFLLSVEIQRRTNRSVSETTLKRFFGFTSCKHNPSQYTLNALAIFCGFSSWNHFKEQIDQLNASTAENRRWMEIRTHLSKITGFHLNVLNKRNPGLPRLKIRRTWVDSYLSGFERSGKNILLISGPAGFGKSLAISAWVEERLSGTDDNIYLYLDGLSLFRSTAHGYNPVKWLANVFDFESTGRLDQFFQEYQFSAPGFIYIIVDGFNEEKLSEDQYYAVFGNLLDIIEHFQSFEWLKFTFVIRTNIYEKLKERLPANYRDTWLSASELQGDRNPIPEEMKFSTSEISEILDSHRIDHAIEELALSCNYPWLRMPPYMDSFLRLHEGYPNINFRDRELKFLLIRDVIEKDITLLNTLEKTDRQQVSEWIRTFPSSDALTDREPIASKRRKTLLRSTLASKLIGRGMLIKNPGETAGSYRFSSPDFKASLYAYYQYHRIGIKKLPDFADTVDLDFPDTDEARGLSLIWFIFFQLEDLDFSFMEVVGREDRAWFPPVNDLLYLVVTFANHLHHSAGEQYREELAEHLIRSQIYTKIVHGTSMPYVRLKRALYLLLELTLGDEHQFRLRLKMALLAFLKWDEHEFISQLEQLVPLQDAVRGQLSINPVAGLSALYHCFKYGKIDNTDLRKVFDTNCPQDGTSVIDQNFSCEIIAYLLLLVAPDEELSANYLDTIRAKMDRLKDTENVAYAFYDLLSRLLIQMIPHRAAACTDRNGPGSSIAFPDLTNSLLGLCVNILALHLDIALGIEDRRQITQRIRGLHHVLEPLGYTVLTKYFAGIAYIRKRNSGFPGEFRNVPKKDHPQKWIN